MTAVDLLMQQIPTFKGEKEIKAKVYKTEKEQGKRLLKLCATFRESFNGQEPDFYVRSPGRVNLIGEHIDYSGYSVLPMAIERDSLMAVTAVPGTSKVELVNVDSVKYPKREFYPSGNSNIVDIDSKIHEWSNYFKCGYKGVLDGWETDKSPVGLNIVVDGTVPTGGGLSSSSSLVCCASLAVLHANNMKMNKGELTRTAIKSETYAGVQIGGMDQSISIMAVEGSALLIDFFPKLDAHVVNIPLNGQGVFVIANTLVTADKHVTAPKNYNLRVVECRLAAALLASKMNLSFLLDSREIPTLKMVHLAKTNLMDFGTMHDAVETFLKKDPYTLQEVALELGFTEDELSSRYIQGINIVKDFGFKLYARAKHVFKEAERVYQFQDACLNLSEEAFFERAGSLMNDSMASCGELFECSCPELEQLSSICRANGAYGSRLTGAGWGGCTVSLVKSKDVTHFMQSIREQYYQKKYPKVTDLDGFLFASHAGVGAAILDIKDS